VTVFGDYSRYYDLLYADKDYEGEAAYVAKLIRAVRPQAKSILDLGCGTGRHARELARLGFTVAGVDVSAEMIAVARQTAAANVRFFEGDLGTVRLGERFDVVSSLFHVFSYQTTNAALAAAFATAEAHLREGGLLIFDAWYGPAVLSDRPVVRVKRLADDEVEVVRIGEPTLHANRNTVDVDFEVLIRDRRNGSMSRITEQHAMRYLFTPEVEAFAAAAGMKLLASEEWLTGRPPGLGTWGVAFVCERL
jgi:SAM-dependent methyltransferase